jgi:hypothetical protein
MKIEMVLIKFNGTEQAKKHGLFFSCLQGFQNEKVFLNELV